MINKIIIQNFKALKKIELDAKPLSLLMGLNGMGKSSLIQTLLILRQSRELDKGNISLSDYLIEIGKGKDAMYQYSHDEHIKFAFEFNEQTPLKWNLKYNPDSNYLESDEKYEWNALYKYSILGKNFQYLKADRQSPQTDYQTSYAEVVNDRQVGIDGRFAVHYLNAFGNERVVQKSLHHKKAKSEILIHQVDAWLSEITPGVKLNTTEIPGTDKVLLDYQFETGSLYTNRFRPKNVGFGLSYVLPVIVSLLSIQKDKLIVLENPESHIHPRGQVELGRLIALAAQNGAQVIAETHSDHVLNGIRVAVKEKLIDNNSVGIFYFERKTSNEEQFSEFTKIKVDERGELSEYPQNFLDEWSNQLLKLI
jgi:predicted ATPase